MKKNLFFPVAFLQPPADICTHRTITIFINPENHYTMATGYSIHIGLNYNNRVHYRTTPEAPTQLPYCINSAAAMYRLAASNGFAQSVLLLDEFCNNNENEHQQSLIRRITGTENGPMPLCLPATQPLLDYLLRHYAGIMQPGDILFISYAGHGFLKKDKNNDEEDGFDETWMMYDKHMVDDELHDLLALFQKDTRILVVSDSCHSGDMIKGLNYKGLGGMDMDLQPSNYHTKSLTGTTSTVKTIQPTVNRKPIQASVLLLSACLPQEEAAGATSYRISNDKVQTMHPDINYCRFTTLLLDTLQDKNYNKSYTDLMQGIIARNGQVQHFATRHNNPDIQSLGANEKSFSHQQPFTI